jgi:hypothetical protein
MEKIVIFSNGNNGNNGNMISVKTEYSNFYCDIYTNPAFPQLDKKF